MAAEEVARFKSVLRNTQTTVLLDIDRRRFFLQLHDQQLAAAGPVVKFNLCIKQCNQLQFMDPLGVPWSTSTSTPKTAVNCREEFPAAQAQPYLANLFSSAAAPIIPPDLLDATALQIYNYAVVTPSPAANPRAAAAAAAATTVHVKADVTVVCVSTKIYTAPENKLARRKSIQTGGIDDVVVIVDEPRLDLKEPRSVKNLKEQYGLHLGECAVCLEQLVVIAGKSAASREVLEMPCSHMFHCGCIFMWLKNRDTCPLCHAVIP